MVSPETVFAAQALLECSDNAHATAGTSHARLRMEANKQLVPYVEKMAQQYNKKAGVQIFQVGQHVVGLQIPVEHREKCDARYILCMVIP